MYYKHGVIKWRFAGVSMLGQHWMLAYELCDFPGKKNLYFCEFSEGGGSGPPAIPYPSGSMHESISLYVALLYRVLGLMLLDAELLADSICQSQHSGDKLIKLISSK